MQRHVTASAAGLVRYQRTHECDSQVGRGSVDLREAILDAAAWRTDRSLSLLRWTLTLSRGQAQRKRGPKGADACRIVARMAVGREPAEVLEEERQQRENPIRLCITRIQKYKLIVVPMVVIFCCADLL